MHEIENYIFGLAQPGMSLRCPFHGDNRPSAVIQPDTGYFYCFVCHERGNQLEIAAKYFFSDVHWHTALLMAQVLLENERPSYVKGSGVRNDPDPTVLEVVNLWQKACAKELVSKPSLIQRLQEERSIFKPAQLGIGYSTTAVFRKFYDSLPEPLKREELLIQAGLLRPYMDPAILPYRKFRLDQKWILPEIRGSKSIYYTAREDGNNIPKYLNPPYRKAVYGMDSLKRNTSYVWLLEGAFDMYPLLEYGESAIAVSGANYSQEILDEILEASKSKIILVAFDNDPPNKNGVSVGQEAAMKCIADIKARGREAALVVPKAKDIGEWISKTSVGNVVADVTWNLQLA